MSELTHTTSTPKKPAWIDRLLPQDPESAYRRKTRLRPFLATVALTAVMAGGLVATYNHLASSSEPIGSKQVAISPSYADQMPGEATIEGICEATLEIADNASLDSTTRLWLGQKCVSAAQNAIADQSPRRNNIVGTDQQVTVFRTEAPVTGEGYEVRVEPASK